MLKADDFEIVFDENGFALFPHNLVGRILLSAFHTLSPPPRVDFENLDNCSYFVPADKALQLGKMIQEKTSSCEILNYLEVN